MESSLSTNFYFKGGNHIFKELLINEQITCKEVRLVGEDGEQLGIVPIDRARAISDEKNLDLVMLTATSNPPVCKMLDYGKFKFDQIKKERELKKNQKIVELKEVQLSLTIDKHDLDVKAKHANRFLTDGDKVKVVLRMKGRQQAFVSKAVEVVKSFFALVEENGSIDKQPEVAGRNIIQIISPKK
ncbi:MAG: translation initiation factor IF-3 [Clostridia bacterium]